MTSRSLKGLLIANSVIIAMYAIAAWLGDSSPLALAIAVVAAMVTQVVVVLRPVRRDADVSDND